MSGVVKVEWQENTDELYAAYRDEQDVTRRKRLHALWLVRRGADEATASHEAGVDKRSLQRWLDWYRQGGLPVVLARTPGHGAVGNACRLSPAQVSALVATAATGQFRSYEEARRWVADEWGVRYGYDGMYTLLARVGVHPKVPRPQAEKADPDVQAAWKKGG